MRNQQAPDPARRFGFTLLELLLCIAVIFALVGLVLFGLKTGRRTADRTVTLNSLRQIMTGYSGYSTEHKGRLLPGCIDPANIGTTFPLTQLDIKAELKSGTPLSAADTSGYVWRLAPYLDYGYSALLADYSKGLQKRYHDEIDVGVYGPGSVGASQLGIGFTPSIGYNSIFLGGDNVHAGLTALNYSPWSSPNPNVPNPTIATFRLSEVRYPARTIAFAACKAVNMTLPDAGEQLGYVELRPPWIPEKDVGECDSRQWTVDDDNQLQPYPGNFDGPGGLMVDRAGGRAGDKVPTAHIDGSVISFNPMQHMEDPTLTTEARLMAIKKVAAAWSPVYAKGYDVAP